MPDRSRNIKNIGCPEGNRAAVLFSCWMIVCLCPITLLVLDVRACRLRSIVEKMILFAGATIGT